MTSCSFMEAVYEVPSNIVGGNSSIATGTMSMASALGLWQYETTNGCKSYLDGSGNNLFQHARSELVAQKSGVAAPIFALSVIFWMVLELCCSRKGSSIPFIKFIVAVFLTVTQICQGLTFLFFHSEQFWYVMRCHPICHVDACRSSHETHVVTNLLFCFSMCHFGTILS